MSGGNTRYAMNTRNETAMSFMGFEPEKNKEKTTKND